MWGLKPLQAFGPARCSLRRGCEAGGPLPGLTWNMNAARRLSGWLSPWPSASCSFMPPPSAPFTSLPPEPLCISTDAGGGSGSPVQPQAALPAPAAARVTWPCSPRWHSVGRPGSSAHPCSLPAAAPSAGCPLPFPSSVPRSHVLGEVGPDPAPASTPLSIPGFLSTSAHPWLSSWDTPRPRRPAWLASGGPPPGRKAGAQTAVFPFIPRWRDCRSGAQNRVSVQKHQRKASVSPLSLPISPSQAPCALSGRTSPGQAHLGPDASEGALWSPGLSPSSVVKSIIHISK